MAVTTALARADEVVPAEGPATLWVLCEPCQGVGGDTATGTICTTCLGMGQVDVAALVRGISGVHAA
jgi:DnaJ-class molecular chaperone